MKAEHCLDNTRVIDATASYKRLGIIKGVVYTMAGIATVRVLFDGFTHPVPMPIAKLRRFDEDKARAL